ncbi:LEM domain-containing protein 1 isoform X7 [Trachypithecus francoisi]|uniref:LEM domain-containing protein 1 isoform X7 n=1 Tax=Trachypithecus francoisi TaxID=54180 RepID=UPI00141AD27C|nr:LEM domain-containing protein 1 isoform X7 [Trachypithecus francoisi]
MVDVKCLSDCKLQNQLEKLGFSPGPILPSTRKLYEKKLVQLLVSPPCAPPVMNGPRELDGAQDSDDSEELNIILQGNIILSTEKSKKLKKNPVFEIQERQEEIVETNPDYNDSKMIIKVVSPSSFQSRIYKVGCKSTKHQNHIWDYHQRERLLRGRPDY